LSTPLDQAPVAVDQDQPTSADVDTFEFAAIEKLIDPAAADTAQPAELGDGRGDRLKIEGHVRSW
jgi:hypothetical protein